MTGRLAGKNHIAGLLAAVTGAIAAYQGILYGVGSVGDIGPGFFPFVLGCILILLGGLIAATRDVTPDGTPAEPASVPPLDHRGAGCIVGGMMLFLVVARYGGMLPAAFAATFVSALGDRSMTGASAILLGLVAVLIGFVLFHSVLKLPLPLFSWG